MQLYCKTKQFVLSIKHAVTVECHCFLSSIVNRPRCRWEDNIKTDLQEVGGGGDWMELAKNRDRWRALVKTVMNFRVP